MCLRFDHVECRVQCFGIRCPSSRLEEPPRQPAAKAFVADRPSLAMAIDLQIRVSGAVRCMEKLEVCREANQDVCLLRRAILLIVVLVGEKFIELGNPAASVLELRSQGLKGGAIVFLEHREPFEHLWCKGCTRVGGSPFHQALQRIADFLGRVDGGGNRIFSFSLLIEIVPRPLIRCCRGNSTSLLSVCSSLLIMAAILLLFLLGLLTAALPIRSYTSSLFSRSDGSYSLATFPSLHCQCRDSSRPLMKDCRPAGAPLKQSIPIRAPSRRPPTISWRGVRAP